MHKSIDADYYGFRDEEDGVLLREEAEATKILRKRKCDEFDAARARRSRGHRAAGATAARRGRADGRLGVCFAFFFDRSFPHRRGVAAQHR